MGTRAKDEEQGSARPPPPRLPMAGAPVSTRKLERVRDSEERSVRRRQRRWRRREREGAGGREAGR